MKRTMRRAALLIALCAPGCTFDYTDPTGPDVPIDTPTMLHVQILANTQDDRLSAVTHLQPGRDTNGRLRTVLSDLLIGGRVVAPTQPPGSDSTMTYEAEWTLSDVAAGGTLTVSAPALEGIPPAPYTFNVEIPARVGSDTLFVAEDEPVVLRVSRPQIPAVPETHTLWQLRLRDNASARNVVISATGSPPEDIVIPRSWFSPGSSALNIVLEIYQSASSEFVPGRYRWAMSVSTALYWTVVLSTSTGASGPGTFPQERPAGLRTFPRKRIIAEVPS